ncbi:MAG: hypothetical protein EXS35_05530 [Pedosphaera sp.]|nr:hypothetical protein [Pedosphaera sp.]
MLSTRCEPTITNTGTDWSGQERNSRTKVRMHQAEKFFTTAALPVKDLKTSSVNLVISAFEVCP